jgi:hypothetical protein
LHDGYVLIILILSYLKGNFHVLEIELYLKVNFAENLNDASHLI